MGLGWAFSPPQPGFMKWTIVRRLRILILWTCGHYGGEHALLFFCFFVKKEDEEMWLKYSIGAYRSGTEKSIRKPIGVAATNLLLVTCMLLVLIMSFVWMNCAIKDSMYDLLFLRAWSQPYSTFVYIGGAIHMWRCLWARNCVRWLPDLAIDKVFSAIHSNKTHYQN